MPQGWTVVPENSAWKPVPEATRPAGIPTGMDLPGFPARPPLAPLDSRNSVQRGFDNLTTVTPEQEAGHGKIVNAAQHFGAGAIEGAGQVFAHPLDTLSGLGQAAMHPIDTAEKVRDQAMKDPAKALGNLVGGAGLGLASEAALKPLISPMLSKIKDAAIGDPDAAALKGLQVGPKSPKALGTIQSVQGARPFLQGASSLEDLQAKIQSAKDEIWSPYKQAVDAIGERPVKGPDGITTVGELESQRAQLSALNRGLKSGSPEAIQLAQQKGMSAAQLLDQEKAVTAALDPELESTGIDPKAIRRTFGNVAQVGGRVSGKSTLIEKPQSYGIGKIGTAVSKADFAKPIGSLFNIGRSVLDGGGDIVAGRPIMSGKPTDVALKDAFSSAGPKPSFGQFRMPAVRGLLNTPSIEDPTAPYEFGVPAKTSIAPESPRSFLRLPAVASDGELKPMVGIKANNHPGLDEDFARTRIAPSKGKIPSTTLPPETEGLMLGAGERLGLPADVGERAIDPRFLQKQGYPALNARTAVEKQPVVFAPKIPNALNGLFTADQEGQIMPARKALSAPAPKPKTIKGKR